MISEEERKKYVEFMYNPENEYNCDECPENKDFDDWEGKYPCGNQNAGLLVIAEKLWNKIQGVNFVFVCDKCTIISKMQNMYKYTNYIFCHKLCITCKSHFIL